MIPRFIDRRDAGRALAERLVQSDPLRDPIVLALPRGGVPVAYEVAAALEAPLDVFVVRKLGAPWNEELAIGAIASGGVRIVDSVTIAALGVSRAEVERIAARELVELERRERLYRRGRSLPDLSHRTVVLVDDGLATGASMRAAVEALRALNPGAIIAAVPVGSPDACAMIDEVADRCICAMAPERFLGVGMFYEDFSQTTDDEVLALLAENEERRAAGHYAAARPEE